MLMKISIDTVAALGLLLKATRMAQRMTRDEISLATGLSPAFISNVEAGKETAQIGKVLNLMRELGIQITGEAAGIDDILPRLKTGGHRRLRK